MARDAQRDFEEAMQAVRTPGTKSNAATVEPSPAAKDVGNTSRVVRTLVLPEPTQTAPTLRILDSVPQVGDSVFVPRECWPSYPCNEFAGEGWAATVRSKTRYTATVSFDHDQTARGLPYAEERLDWMVLKGFA